MKKALLLVLFATSLSAIGCSGPEEAPRVELQVAVDATPTDAVTTDEGYRVELNETRIAIETISFAVAGEAHQASLLELFASFLVGEAQAHPGHMQNGIMTGSLAGAWLADFQEGNPLGEATFLTGEYESANFGLARAGTEMVAEDDPMHGHTAMLEGTVSRGDESWTLRVLIDSPPDRVLTGAPFEANIDENTSKTVYFRFDPYDAFEEDTLFDHVDFAALDRDGDGTITIGPDASEPELVDAYNRIRRTFQTHDHFSFHLR